MAAIRSGDDDWPARSCDLTQLNYFLRDAVHERRYADKPVTIKHLKANIRDAITEI